MLKTLFLPGAGGSASFWRPLAERAQLDGEFLGWPGLGNEPADPSINRIDDLVAFAASEVTEPVNIIAQSMGGYIALKLALAFPALVRSLVLAVTSGGVPMADLGGADWRANHPKSFPLKANWIAHPVDDLSRPC